MDAKHSIRAVYLLLALTTLACERRAPEPAGPTANRVVDPGKFGDPYRIVSNFNPADPDLYPELSGDTLRIRITYSGGCETHEFDVDHDTRGDTAFVWIRHDAGDDECEALIQDEIQTTLPGRVADARVLALLHPQGGAPHALRTRAE